MGNIVGSTVPDSFSPSSGVEFAEPNVALFEQEAVWPPRLATGQSQRLAVKSLKAVDQHRSIFLLEHISSNLDDVVRPDADHVSIEGGMV